jgi:hypothetical protein
LNIKKRANLFWQKRLFKNKRNKADKILSPKQNSPVNYGEGVSPEGYFIKNLKIAKLFFRHWSRHLDPVQWYDMPGLSKEARV